MCWNCYLPVFIHPFSAMNHAVDTQNVLLFAAIIFVICMVAVNNTGGHLAPRGNGH